uniref:Putative C1q domain containing protein MgC1q71 n=1 Tax=Mytilus galloprovincialis TaxID=29158 RepID=F0V4A8_MYTGA|nr:putative C1q domain containing protein MgC1q71 [Mytilus galloprovincialis]
MSFYTTVLTLLLLAEIVMGSCDTKLECSLLSDLLEMSMKQKSPDKGCQCLSRTTIPAFQSMLTKPQTPGDKGVVKFDKVVINTQNGYDPTTGVFTAPVAGVYQFSYTVMSQDGKYLVVYLSHNNIRQQTTWLKGSSHETGKGNMILSLKKGDLVCVKSSGSYTINSSNNLYSSFFGYLIAQ